MCSIFCGTGIVQNRTYFYVWDVVAGEEKNYDLFETGSPRHRWPTLVNITSVMSRVGYHHLLHSVTPLRHKYGTRLHKESTEPKFGTCHPFVSKLWMSRA